MVKANRGQIAAALKALDPRFRGVLVFGRDEGLIRERAETIAGQAVDDLSDPFRVARLGPAELKETPSRLADEMAALSLTGGRRLVRVDDAGDAMTAAVEAALAGPETDSLMVLVGGDLGPRSKLRKLAEGHDALISIACYPDEQADLEGLVRAVADEAALTVQPDAMAYLLANLGGDRALSRRELEKLVLYKLDDTARVITVEDARACIGDGSAMTVQRIIDAVAGGAPADLDGLIERAYAQGDNPVALLRTTARRFQQLQLLRAWMAKGLNATQAVAKLTPPPIFKDRSRVIAQAQAWTPAKLARALDKLTDAEIGCKTTGTPAEALCHRTLIEIAAAARAR